MKKISNVLLIAMLLLTIACNNETKENETAKEEVPVVEPTNKLESKTYLVSNSESKVMWAGKAVGHGHNGTVNVVAGKFEVKDGQITAGKLSIDMTSIEAVDLKDEAEDKAKLEGHLKNEDFFNVVEFPVANIEIIDASNLDSVKANLTIKDQTHEIVFPLAVNIKDDVVMLDSKFSFDRTMFGVTYKSNNFFENLGDKAIYDDIEMLIELVAK